MGLSLKVIVQKLKLRYGSEETVNATLREMGMRIGKDSRIYTLRIPGEAYLVRVGDRCAIGGSQACSRLERLNPRPSRMLCRTSSILPLKSVSSSTLTGFPSVKVTLRSALPSWLRSSSSARGEPSASFLSQLSIF